MNDQACTHLDQIKPVTPSGKGCVECLEQGTKWVSLRMCLTCGHVGCCDSTIGQHARAHFNDTGHAIMESYETAGPGQNEWRWCYVDEMIVG